MKGFKVLLMAGVVFPWSLTMNEEPNYGNDSTIRFEGQAFKECTPELIDGCREFVDVMNKEYKAKVCNELTVTECNERLMPKEDSEEAGAL